MHEIEKKFLFCVVFVNMRVCYLLLNSNWIRKFLFWWLNHSLFIRKSLLWWLQSAVSWFIHELLNQAANTWNLRDVCETRLCQYLMRVIYSPFLCFKYWMSMKQDHFVKCWHFCIEYMLTIGIVQSFRNLILNAMLQWNISIRH